MDQTRICDELSALYRAIAQSVMADYADLLKRLDSVARIAPDDDDLQATVQTGRRHIWERQSLADQLAAQGGNVTGIGAGSAGETNAAWVAAYFEYSGKHCSDAGQP